MSPGSSQIQLLRQKALWAALLGAAFVLLPLALDRCATGRAKRAVRTVLAKRLGADVDVDELTLRGPFAVEI
ncbi:MAG: hypothetical protein ABI333_25850, partial [bacterium]